MTNLCLVLSYDGSSFLGWQHTEEGPTVEGELSRVLSTIFQQEISLQAASRTDAGVHAEGQVVNFHVHHTSPSPSRLLVSLNQMLPTSIRIIFVRKISTDFHATLDAKGKLYHYFLTTETVQLPFERHYAWHVRGPLDLSKMREAARQLTGTHDFSTFCNRGGRTPGKDQRRTLYHFDIVKSSNGRVRCELYGDGFLYKMVRNLVGTVVKVGLGKLSLKEIVQLLARGERELAGTTAPAHGLLLKRVTYSPEIEEREEVG